MKSQSAEFKHMDYRHAFGTLPNSVIFDYGQVIAAPIAPAEEPGP